MFDAPRLPEPPVARPAASGSAGRDFLRAVLAVATGFLLPVLACYGLIFVSGLTIQLMSFLSPARRTDVVSSGAGPAVAVIPVEGVITSGRQSNLFPNTSVAAADTIVDQIRRAEADGDVRAIVLYVNSPGGGVNASDVIYHTLEGVDKPVVVLMGDTAASGGYYISMAADWIVAHPNTLTGSIGVISEFTNASGLLDKVGVDVVVITSGPRKDFGSPYREMTDAERQYWQGIVDETYADFVAIVAQGRHLPADQVLSLADGRVFTGRQALDAGLVDALGYKEDAIAKAAELGGIAGEPRIIEYTPQPRLFDLLAEAAGNRPALLPSVAEILALVGHPRLEARWTGP
jgi:protease-4